MIYKKGVCVYVHLSPIAIFVRICLLGPDVLCADECKRNYQKKKNKIKKNPEMILSHVKSVLSLCASAAGSNLIPSELYFLL